MVDIFARVHTIRYPCTGPTAEMKLMKNEESYFSTTKKYNNNLNLHSIASKTVT